MKVVIIEDEKMAAENLKYLLSEADTSIVVEKVIATVSDAVDFFMEENDIELAFFDIHLADGISFEIFEKVKISAWVVFTTAFDEYAVKAFKYNSIDYLLKPIDEDELVQSIEKYKRTRLSVPYNTQLQKVLQILNSEKKAYKETYLVQYRDTLIPLKISEIAYFIIDMGIVKAVSFTKNEYTIDENLEDIEMKLNPYHFFRANRQYIVQRKAIKNLQLYFNGKLILNLEPNSMEQIVISKVKVPQLKKWIG